MSEKKWLLEKYARWECNGWIQQKAQPQKELALIIEGTQILIMNGQLVLESVSLAQSSQKIKAIYKNQTLAIAIQCKEKSTRFRVMFNSSESGVKCIDSLRKYITVTGSTGGGFEPSEIENTATLPSILAQIMSNEKHFLPVPDSIPAEFPLESAIKLCILDPGFPALVNNVESVISKIRNSED